MRSVLPICLSKLLRKRDIQVHGALNLVPNCHLSTKSKDRIRIKEKPGTLSQPNVVRLKGPEKNLSNELLQYKQQYPVHFSVHCGRISDASLVMADINAVNALDLSPKGGSHYPLMRAAMVGLADMIKFLIDRGGCCRCSLPARLYCTAC